MLIRLQRIAQKKGAGHWLDQRAFFSTNDAKDRKPIMPPLLHLFISGADQHCLNMTNAEALASTIDRGEEFARRFSDIDTLGRIEAIIAIAAIIRWTFRSEECPVGKECCRTCNSRWSQDH